LVGYLHADDEHGVFDSEGFYRTGDLAHWMDDDFLVIDGRSKDIIIRNGENISPKELEDLLVASADIAEIAIVGLPHDKTGEQACAVIVPTPGSIPSVMSISDTLAQHGVAKFKYPERVELWPNLPKNDAGKVLKHRIRDRLLQR
jgi:non-ribosomal peptide synthetase component E (peptide arylation enzyme)